jgi:hypothetical protein
MTKSELMDRAVERAVEHLRESVEDRVRTAVEHELSERATDLSDSEYRALFDEDLDAEMDFLSEASRRVLRAIANAL